MSDIWLVLAVASVFFSVVLVGIAIESGSGEYRLQIGLLVHAEGRFAADDANGAINDTFAIRCTGTCAGESAKAQPFERETPRASAFCRAMRRSSW